MLYSVSKAFFSIAAVVAFATTNNGFAQTTAESFQLKCISGAQNLAGVAPSWIIIANGTDSGVSAQSPFGIVTNVTSADAPQNISVVEGTTSAEAVSEGLLSYKYTLNNNILLKIIQKTTYTTEIPSHCGRGGCEPYTIKTQSYTATVKNNLTDISYICSKI